MRELLNDFDDSPVGDPVVHEQALALHVYQEAASQFLQVMGDEGLGEIHLVHDGRDGLLASTQRQKDSKTILIRKALTDKGHDAETLIDIYRLLLFFGRHDSSLRIFVAAIQR